GGQEQRHRSPAGGGTALCRSRSPGRPNPRVFDHGAWNPARVSTLRPLSDRTYATKARAAALFGAFFSTTMGYSLIAPADSGNSTPSTSDEAARASVR